MAGLYDNSFWDDESESLWEDLAEVIIGALLSGVEGGTDLLPANARVLVDFDHVNTAAKNKNTPKGASFLTYHPWLTSSRSDSSGTSSISICSPQFTQRAEYVYSAGS
jgi:hypothetical protein